MKARRILNFSNYMLSIQNATVLLISFTAKALTLRGKSQGKFIITLPQHTSYILFKTAILCSFLTGNTCRLYSCGPKSNFS